MNLGISDPIAFLDQPSDDLLIASVIVEKAEELRNEHEDHLARNAGIHFANAMVKAFGGK